MNNYKNHIFLFLLLYLASIAINIYAQNPIFKVEGTVHGYEYNPGQGLLKKNKPTLLEGTLENVRIYIIQNNDTVQQTTTNEKGLFAFELPFDTLSQLILFKEGYNHNLLIIDTRAFSNEIKNGGYAFTGAEFVLNSFKSGTDSSLHKNLGRLYFNPPLQQFNLNAKSQQVPSGLFVSTPPKDTPVELLQRAIEKNNKQLQNYTPLPALAETIAQVDPKKVEKPVQPSPKTQKVKPTKIPAKQIQKINSDSSFSFPQKPVLTGIDEYLQQWEEAIVQEKGQISLARLLARSQQDSLQIAQREQKIDKAEEEIAHARMLISSQNQKLTTQRNSLYLTLSLLMLSAGLLLTSFTYYRQKQKASQLIESKNKQITASINYARKIQQSILVSENKLCEYLPESFVFWQPKAIVSGDFYFIAKSGSKYLVAAADCTGHGVPGAFMSLIGHRLLREIVVEKKNTNPASVLAELHSGILESLQQSQGEEFTQDGMDIAVCLIDPQERSLVYAGAMNSAYMVAGQELLVLQADVKSVGGKSLRPERESNLREFTNKMFSYKPGTMLYLFTDGYMDQFGGQNDRKYNTRRFKQLLLDIYLSPASHQKDIIRNTLLEWKGQYSQTDDVLLLGIRLP